MSEKTKKEYAEENALLRKSLSILARECSRWQALYERERKKNGGDGE